MSKYIGAHVSASGGVQNTPLAADAIGAKAFALFTGFSNRWASKQISDEIAEAFKSNCEAKGYDASVILPHDNFLINLGSPDPQKLAMSRKSFLDEFRRCEALGLKMLNFHPGSHLGQLEVDACLDLIAESINITLDQTEGVMAVLESTAGQGTNLGYRFEHLARIIDRVEDKTRVDRHELIGLGSLGEEFFIRLVNDPRFDDMPLILETPDPDRWAEEIAWLYSMIGK